MYVNISTSDATVIHDCLVKFMSERRGRKPHAAVRLVSELAEFRDTTTHDLATYGVCDPAPDRRFWVPHEITEFVWDALNIHAYEAGPCPCGDDPGRCIIQRWFDFVWQPTVTLPTTDPRWLPGGEFTDEVYFANV